MKITIELNKAEAADKLGNAIGQAIFLKPLTVTEISWSSYSNTVKVEANDEPPASRAAPDAEEIS